ncbi:MAG TPA: type II toxin-antitoxin system VapC family toxin [candidate division WOR-3 bacterium]|uniref:Type II toxin-antitoxin system VapC family toxin n=1 Tax=candidate division WOR-3 bacterium TaxID=2052148 RepID=A0A7V0XEK9_UNCW3|nr:type II toxin-antitoxin system VapC family toxin [candidate division WOR-3 bacterium]
MAKSRSQFVVDANVLIDLRDGRILDRLGRLPEQFIVADIVVADDIDEPDEAVLTGVGIGILPLSGDAVQEVVAVTGSCRGISVADAASLVLAEQVGCTLLTGDKLLRGLALSRGVKVHGTLWLLDRMAEGGALTGEQAAVALERMLECGRRLPKPEARNRILDWRADEEG